MKDYSQHGEQSIMADILEQMGLDTGTIVDLGAGDGWTISNSRRLLELGWKGVLIDVNGHGDRDVHEHFLTRENVVAIVSQYTDRVDVLTIDLDGNDYWILYALLESMSPSLIVCEINTRFEEAEAVAIVYDPAHKYDGTDYYGMSMGAVRHLCDKFGYALVDYNGLNAFMVRSNLRLTPRNWAYSQRFDHRPGSGRWVSVK